MVDAGVNAILIKVAGIGLSVKHLGETLAEMHSWLRDLVSAMANKQQSIFISFRIAFMVRIYAVKVASTRR